MFTVKEISTSEFQVIDHDGRLFHTYATLPQAEASAKTQNTSDEFWSDWLEQNEAYETGVQETEVQPVSEPEEIEEDKILIEGQNVVGSTIEFGGHSWTVYKCEYISEADAADAEDGWDMSLQPGWHSWLKKGV